MGSTGAHLGLGAHGERVAQAYLKRAGYRIIATNYRCSLGEIDIVAAQRELLCFVEVKTRRGRGCAAECVPVRKRRRLGRLAEHFVRTHRHDDHPWRFDVVLVLVAPDRTCRVEHWPGAFDPE